MPHVTALSRVETRRPRSVTRFGMSRTNGSRSAGSVEAGAAAGSGAGSGVVVWPAAPEAQASAISHAANTRDIRTILLPFGQMGYQGIHLRFGQGLAEGGHAGGRIHQGRIRDPLLQPCGVLRP